MTAAELFSFLENLVVEPDAHGEKLRYNAPYR